MNNEKQSKENKLGGGRQRMASLDQFTIIRLHQKVKTFTRLAILSEKFCVFKIILSVNG